MDANALKDLRRAVHGPAPRVTRPLVRRRRKVGPNEPCPCGSGKKFKRCCLRKG